MTKNEDVSRITISLTKECDITGVSDRAAVITAGSVSPNYIYKDYVCSKIRQERAAV